MLASVSVQSKWHSSHSQIVWAHGGSDFTDSTSLKFIRRLMHVHLNLYIKFVAGLSGRDICGCGLP